MDKEDCTQAILATLQRPPWKHTTSTNDWDLKSILWEAGLLLTPEQVAALLADMKRRGLIAGRERRVESRIVAMWGVRITRAGEDWLLQRAQAPAGAARRPPPATPAPNPPPRAVPAVPVPAAPEAVPCGRAPRADASGEVGSTPPGE